MYNKYIGNDEILLYRLKNQPILEIDHSEEIFVASFELDSKNKELIIYISVQKPTQLTDIYKLSLEFINKIKICRDIIAKYIQDFSSEYCKEIADLKVNLENEVRTILTEKLKQIQKDKELEDKFI
jgi:hypothetical protein